LILKQKIKIQKTIWRKLAVENRHLSANQFKNCHFNFLFLLARFLAISLHQLYPPFQNLFQSKIFLQKPRGRGGVIFGPGWGLWNFCAGGQGQPPKA